MTYGLLAAVLGLLVVTGCQGWLIENLDKRLRKLEGRE